MNHRKDILRISLLSVLISSLTISHAISQNLVKYPGFETGVFSPFWGFHVENEFSSIVIDNNIVNSGTSSAKLTGVRVLLYQPFNFEPNTTYKLSASIKTESGEIAKLGAKEFGGIEVSKDFNDTNFKTDSLEFTTNGNPGNNPQIYVWKPNGSGSVWVDDVKLTAVTTIPVADEPGGLGTYYVSLSGNDNNSGTSQVTAWRTINKVNSKDFAPGDKILFDGGSTFAGNIRFKTNDSGTTDNYIHLGSYGTGRATIDPGSGSGFIATDCEYISIKNLNFIGVGRNAGNSGNGVNFSYCSNILVDSVEISGFQHSGLTARNVGTNYRFTNVNAHDNGYAGIFISGIDKTSLSNIYIGYCIADNNPGDPTVLDNHSGNGIFAFNANNVTIEYCMASNNGREMPWNGNGPGGIWVAEVDSAIIQYCISHDNKTPEGAKDGLGFDLDGGTTNSVIQYCLSYNNQGAGYGIFQYNGATDWSNNIVRYCISENDGNTSAKGSVYFWNGSGQNEQFQGFEFYNNVVYNTNGPALAFLDHKNLNFNFRNNIFVSKSGKVYDGIAGENFQGNCWYSLINSNYFQDSINFQQWAQDGSQEMLIGEIVGMYANPMLINPGNSTLTDPRMLSSVDDYKLQEGSAAIDAGLDLETLFIINPGQQDYFGNFLQQGQAFDMGVYQNLDKQVINFTNGWNIMSANSFPSNPDIESVFQPLISNGSLIKIQDETGNSFEDLGIYGDWMNNIGDIALTEGYKVKVNANDSIEFYGPTVDFPFAIPLKTGWNIISYPHSQAFDGLEVVQELIDRNTLIKVQDESGSSIEDLGIYGNWTNNIGNFLAGKGYKVKVSADDTLWIYSSYPKSNTIKPELFRTTHFQPVFEGNGIDHMNIYLFDLPLNDLMSGDELAVFDGVKCVGSVKLMPHHLRSNFVSIVVSAKDNQGMNGFTQGNSITLKLWNSQQNREIVLEPEILKGTSTFAKNETTFASLEKYVITGLEEISGSNDTEINCYPNPFSDELTIEIILGTDSEVFGEVLNQLGQQVNMLKTGKKMNKGNHHLKWNGKNSANQSVSAGIYYIKMIVGDEIFFKKVVYN